MARPRNIKGFMRILLALFLSAATSLAATGSWNGVAFTAWNGIAQTGWNGTSISCAGGGGGGGTPTFGSEIQRNTETSGSSTTVLTLASAVAQNERVFVIVSWNTAAGETVSTVTDSKGNTYTKDKESLQVIANQSVSLWSANAGTALTTSDTVTITWGTPGFSFRSWVILKGSGMAASSAVDQTGSATGLGTAVSAPATTTTANTLLIGTIMTNDQNDTYSGSNWTISGAAHNWGTYQNYYFQKAETSAG